MSTASLPEPLAEGDLGRTPFAHLLLYVRQHALTGSLVIWDPSVGEERPKQDRIRFESGAPVRGRLLESASRLDRGMLPLPVVHDQVGLVPAEQRRAVIRLRLAVVRRLFGHAD